MLLLLLCLLQAGIRLTNLQPRRSNPTPPVAADTYIYIDTSTDMFSNNTNQTRTFDRLVGIFVTLGVVLSLGVAKYVKRFVSSATGVPFILMQWCVCVYVCVLWPVY